MKKTPAGGRTKIAFMGMIGFVVAGSLISQPAQAQLGDLTKAASKLATKLTGGDVSSSTVSGTTPALPTAATDKSARVMLLDKQTNRRQNLIMVVGQTQTVGTLQVKLTKCLPDYGAVLGQDVAWLDVTESSEGSGRTAPWFSGWMFNTYPEISTLDHPRYDVQLLGCGVKARQVVKATGSAPVLDSAPVVDTESSNDASADPYYVPGVEKNVSATAPAAPVETPAATPAAEPVVDTEAPTDTPVKDEAPAAVEPQEGAAPASGQEDLHKMMDSGQY